MTETKSFWLIIFDRMQEDSSHVMVYNIFSSSCGEGIMEPVQLVSTICKGKKLMEVMS